MDKKVLGNVKYLYDGRNKSSMREIAGAIDTYRKQCEETDGYIRVLEKDNKDLRAEVDKLKSDIDKLAVGNLKAQHRAAKEITRLRKKVKESENDIQN